MKKLLLIILLPSFVFGQNIEEIIKEKTELIELETDSLTVLRDSLETKIKELEEKKQNELAVKETELDLINNKKRQNILVSSLISQSETQNKLNELLKIENIMDSLVADGIEIILKEYTPEQWGYVMDAEEKEKMMSRALAFKSDLAENKTYGEMKEVPNKIWHRKRISLDHIPQYYTVRYSKGSLKLFQSFVEASPISNNYSKDYGEASPTDWSIAWDGIRQHLDISLQIQKYIKNANFIDLSSINKSESQIGKLIGAYKDEKDWDKYLYTVLTGKYLKSLGNQGFWENIRNEDERFKYTREKVKDDDLFFVRWLPAFYNNSKWVIPNIDGYWPSNKKSFLYNPSINLTVHQTNPKTYPVKGFRGMFFHMRKAISPSKFDKLRTEFGLSLHPQSFSDSIATLFMPEFTKYSDYEIKKKEIDSIIVDTKLQLGEITALVEKGEKEIHRLKSNYREQITPLENKVLKCNLVIDSKDERIANVTIEEDRRLEAVTEGDKYKKEKNYKMAISKYKMALNIRQSDDVKDKLEKANKLYAPILAKEQEEQRLAKEERDRLAREEARRREKELPQTAFEHLKGYLKSPRSASMNKYAINKINGCRTVVTLEVDSQNGFGAYIRNSFNVFFANGKPCYAKEGGLTEVGLIKNDYQGYRNLQESVLSGVGCGCR